MKYKRVLVVSPHTDDGEYGAAGTIARLVDEGAKVYYLALNAPTDELEAECFRATKLLGVKETRILRYPRRSFDKHRQDILQTLINHENELEPDLVLVPSTMDRHQDHQIVAQEATRSIFLKSTVLGYEIPHNVRQFDYAVRLTPENLKKKMFTLSQYKSQIRRYCFDPDFIQSWARFRGGQIGDGLAEAFQVIRMVEW